MSRRTARAPHPLLVFVLLAAIGFVGYFNWKVVPTIPPIFLSTPTPTRSPESFINEANQYFEEGKLSQAVTSYQQAIIAAPGNVQYHIDLARLQIYAGEYEDGQISAENALLLNSNNSMAHAMKAWALYYQRDFDNAEVSVRRAIELDDNNAAAQAIFAEILVDRGNFEDIEAAIGLSQKAQELAPSALETHRARGAVLLATGNYEEAIAEYEAALAINDKLWDLHYRLGVAYRIIGDYALAQSEMLAAIAFNPNNPDIPTDLSRTYAVQGQFGKAAQYAEQAVSLDPSNPRAHANLGFMYYRNQEYDKAIASLSLAIRGGTTTDGVNVSGMRLESGRVAEYYSVFGMALVRLNRCEEAVQYFQVILQNISSDEVAYQNALEGMEACKDGAPTPEP
jgi:tetratricopeptide (TPR) repeat protein